MAGYDELRKAGRLVRRVDSKTASATSATANNTPLLPFNPKRVAWVVINTGANAARVARRAGVVTTTVGIPLAANDGLVGEHFEAAGESVKDPVYVLMATGDQTVYVEEIEVEAQ